MHNRKNVLIDNSRYAALNAKVFIFVNADVPFILEHRPKTVFVELCVLCRPIPFGIEGVANLSNGSSVGVEVKGFSNDSCSCFIYYEFLVLNLIAERNMTAYAMTFVCRFKHSSRDFLRKLFGVKLSHTFEDCFKDNPFRVVRDVLGCRNDTNTILFESCFIGGRIISVPGEAVELIDNDTLP